MCSYGYVVLFAGDDLLDASDNLAQKRKESSVAVEGKPAAGLPSLA